MNRVIVDPELQTKLQGLDKPVQICDAAGRTVGQYLPNELYLELLCQIARGEVITEEERRQALEDHKAGRCYTTAEVLSFIDKLAKSRKESA